MTGFVGMSFNLLLGDPTPEAAILKQISLQISNLTTPSGSITSSAYTDHARPAPAALAVLVNILWFASLLLSLISASMAILVRQWLQEYTVVSSSEIYENALLQQYRYESYKRWNIDLFIKLHPLLLQLALLLFCIGLPIFLWFVHPVVAYIILSIVCGWLTLWMFTVVMPTICASSPYRSAEALAFSTLCRSIKFVFHWVRDHIHMHRNPSDHAGHRVARNPTWRDSDIQLVQNQRKELGWQLIERARKDFRDESTLACALNASLVYAPEDTENTGHILKELWTQIERTTSIRAGRIWEWIPDGSASNLTAPLINTCIDAVKAWNFSSMPKNAEEQNDAERNKTADEQKTIEGLIIILAKFASYQKDDKRSRDIVRAINALPRQQALGGFPCKEQFVKKMLRKIKLNRSSEFHLIYVAHFLMYSVGLDAVNEISSDILQLWLTDRQHWLPEHLQDFADVITHLVDAVIDDIPSSVSSRGQQDGANDPAKFRELFTRFPLILRQLNNPPLTILDSGALFKLGNSICEVLRRHPALWAAVQGFFIWQITRHIVEKAKRDPDSRAAFPLLSLKIISNDYYFSISFRDENLEEQANLVIKRSHVLSGR